MGSEQQQSAWETVEDTLAPSPTVKRIPTSLGGLVGGAATAEPATLDGNSPDAAAYLRTAAAPDASSIPSQLSGSQFLPPLDHWSLYELIARSLARAAWAPMYKARDRRLGRLVAIKFIRDPDENRVARFIQEARAQSRIEHPNILQDLRSRRSGRPGLYRDAVRCRGIARSAAEDSIDRGQGRADGYGL